MRVQEIDNSFRLSQTVLWQYDHAPNLIGMFAGMGNDLKEVVSDFWDWFAEHVANVDADIDAGEEASLFGLNMWGITLGIPRPFIPHGQITSETSVDGEGNTVYALSNEVYRRLLKAKAYMMDANASTSMFAEGLRIAFEGRVALVDGSDLSPQSPMVMYFANHFNDGGTAYCFSTEDGTRLYHFPFLPQEGDAMYEEMEGALIESDMTFDPATMVRDEEFDIRAKVPGTPYIDEPAAPQEPATEEELHDYNVRMEEYDLLTNPDILETVFTYPAGVKTDGGDLDTQHAIGLNDSQLVGQNLRNFAPKHADVLDDYVNGGQFGFTEER